VPLEKTTRQSALTSAAHDEAVLVTAAVARPSLIHKPFFIGTGGYADLLSIVSQTERRHFTIPSEVERTLSPEDLAYLGHKGCFSLPPDSKDLIRAYMLYVHPTFPILNAHAISQQCADGRLDRINLLLLWSMLSVAASYVPEHAKAAVKASWVARAQLLFHLTEENDKIVLVQSALLLSFWFAEAEDTKQSWYWTGIAFSIAQTLGLHLDSQDGPDLDREVRHNLWRACMLRDVWLSYTMGRPLRLDPAVCSVPNTSVVDIQLRDILLFDDGTPILTTTDATQMSTIWNRLVCLASSLRVIVNTDRSHLSHPLSAEDMRSPSNGGAPKSLPLIIAERHLQLTQRAVQIACYQHQEDLVSATKAAVQVTSSLQTYLADETINLVAPTAVPLIMPAVLTFLRSEREEVVQNPRHTNNVQICLEFLEAIEPNYPAAAILKRLVLAAQRWPQSESFG
jgi:hypothetical protein